MNIERLETLYESGDVNRLHSVATVGEHRISSHVYGSQLIAAELCAHAGLGPASLGAILLTLLYHDAPEVETGDVPAPVKRASPLIDEALTGLEEQFYSSLGLHLPELTLTQHQIVKASDTLDLCFNALRERRLGNRSRRIGTVFRNAMSYLDELYHVAGVPLLKAHLEKEWADAE